MRYVIKRDGRKSKFNENKIANAIYKAMVATNNENKSKAELFAGLVKDEVINRYNEDEFPEVEEIQNIIENILIQQGEEELAKYHVTPEEANNIVNIICGFANEFYNQKLNNTLLNAKNNFPTFFI